MDKLIGLGVVGFIIWTIATHSLAATPALSNLDLVTQLPPTFKLLGTPDDATGTFKIYDKKSGALVGAFFTDDRGMLYEDPKQTENGTTKATYEPVDTALRLGTDFGAIAGYSATRGPVAAVRYSPCRVFDYVAPDIIAGPEAVGLGVSAYLPRTYGPQWLSHIGLGIWYTSDLHGAMAPVAGLTISTK